MEPHLALGSLLGFAKEGLLGVFSFKDFLFLGASEMVLDLSEFRGAGDGVDGVLLEEVGSRVGFLQGLDGVPEGEVVTIRVQGVLHDSVG